MKLEIKKRLRGVFAVVATAALALSIAPVAAQAADWSNDAGTAKITISNVESSESVTLYKVATTSLEGNGTLKYTATDSTHQTDIDTYVKDASNASAIATWAATLSGEGIVFSEGTRSGNEVSFAGMGAGLYYVSVTGGDYTYQPCIVAVNVTAKTDGSGWEIDDVTAAPKKEATSTEVDKKVFVDDNGATVDSDGTAQDSGYAMVGDTLTFQVEFTLDYDTSEFEISDSMSAGLELVSDSFVLSKNGVTVDNPSDSVYEVNETDDGFILTFVKGWLTKKDGAGVSNVHAGNYVLTYKATVTDEATIDGVNNKVSTSVDTDGDTVEIDFLGLSIFKYGELGEDDTYTEGTDPALSGVQFKLYESDGVTVVKDNDGNEVILTTGSDGMATTAQNVLLKPGTYYLEELNAPAGYSKLTDKVEVNLTSASEMFEISNTPLEEGSTILPSTGGAGTVALTVVGVGLMAGAAFLVMRSRKEN